MGDAPSSFYSRIIGALELRSESLLDLSQVIMKNSNNRLQEKLVLYPSPSVEWDLEKSGVPAPPGATSICPSLSKIHTDEQAFPRQRTKY